MADLKIYADIYTRYKVENQWAGWLIKRVLLHSQNIEELKVINPKCSLEIDSPGNFTFTILPNNPYYNDLCEQRTECFIKIDENIIFCGRIVNISDNFYMERKITCEGSLGYLKDSILRPNEYNTKNITADSSLGSEALETLMFAEQQGEPGDLNYSGEGWVSQHNSQMDDCHWKCFNKVGAIYQNISEKNFFRYTNYETTFDALKDKIIDRNNIHIRCRYIDNGSNEGIAKVIEFSQGDNGFKNNSSDIRFGVNLIDYANEIDTQSVKSSLIPLGKTVEGDFSAINNRVNLSSYLNIDYIENEDAITKYGRIYSTEIFEEISNSSMENMQLLKKNGEEKLNELILGIKSYSLTSYDLLLLTGKKDMTIIGDEKHVICEPHGVDVRLMASKIDLDFENLSNSKITLGKTVSTFTEKMSLLKNRVQSGKYTF